jgi:ABC-type multidrug transport system fused ATPase/permease subunit
MAFGLLFIYTFQRFVQGQFNFGTNQIGMLAKGALSQAVYKTAFRHSVPSRAKHPTGKLITHLSADAMRLQQTPRQLVTVLVAPVTLVACLILLCIQIGVAGLIGFIVIVLASPFQGYIAKLVFEQRRKSTAYTEKRSKLLQELLMSMSTIKMFTYERPFMARLNSIRADEMDGVRNIRFLLSLSLSVMQCLPLLGSVFAFIMYSALHPRMDIANLFTAVTYFMTIQGPLTMVPVACAALASCANALERVSTVFDAETRSDTDEADRIVPDLDVAIRVKHASFQWEAPEAPSNDILEFGPPGLGAPGMRPPPGPPPGPPPVPPPGPPGPMPAEAAPLTDNKAPAPVEPFSIKGLDLEVPRGQLAAIIGPVGSGKSSILQALLGEMRPTTAGAVVQFGGTIGYCQQTAWIKNGSLRDNILFGQSWDEERYWACIRQAQMTRDLEILADGDLTEVR